MKYTRLGEFEELVLLAIGALQEEAYSVSIKKEIEAIGTFNRVTYGVNQVSQMKDLFC